MELLMCILQLLQEHGSIERARLIDMFTKNLSAMDFNGCSSGANSCMLLCSHVLRNRPHEAGCQGYVQQW